MKLKITLPILFSAIAISLAMLFSANVTYAVDDKNEITEGTEYWIGVPHCARELGEQIRGDYPQVLWLSSKVRTKAYIYIPWTSYFKTYVIKPNEITQVPLGDDLMQTVSEVITNGGIQIKSDDPISVAVYLSYRWSGEAYRCIPVEWLGKKYVTLCLYQDKTDEYKQGQILIIATMDKTQVKYIPSCATAGNVEKGKMATVTLNQGQTFLIKNKIIPGLNQDWSTDLTGTWIESSKPIAVISGHTKGAFPRYPATMLGRAGNFMRNMLTEMVWPVELCGTQYISAPIRYAGRTRGQIQDDKGDLVRIVATENETQLEQMRLDGSQTYKVLHPSMKRGEVYNLINQETPSIYRASKPVLVGQYGKTWWSYAVSPIVNKEGDQPQNPSSNGQGMLITLAPIERWTSYASFRSPNDIDNFVYVTFKGEQLNNLYFDGKSFISKFGTAVQYVAGSEYAYIAEQVSAGDHYIQGEKGAKFAGYAYGNWDRSKDGFAYGYPIGINYAQPCDDKVDLTSSQICGKVDGLCFVTPDTADCARLYSVTPKEIDNYKLNYTDQFDKPFERGVSTQVKFQLNVEDMGKPAKATLVFITKSGSQITKTWEYIPEVVEGNPSFLNFGLLPLNQTKSLKFTLKNPGTGSLVINKLKLRNDSKEFVINYKDYPIPLAPGATKDIEVIATALVLSDNAVRDSIIAELSCYERPIVGLMLYTGEPVVWIDDADFGQVPLGQERWKDVDIINQGTVPVILDRHDWPDKTHFKVENLNFPLTLEKDQKHTFTVFYKPTVAGVQDQTRDLFEGNTVKVKIYSDWKGIGIDAGPTITGYDWKRQRVIDDYNKNVNGITEYKAQITIGNVGETSALSVKKVEIIDNPDNVFRLVGTQIPSSLGPMGSKNLDVFFAPMEEKEYTATVRFTAEFASKELIAEATLHGIGIQPHFNIEGKTFGTLIVGKSDFGDGALYSVLKNNLTSMNLTITEVKIADDQKSSFQILPNFFTDYPYPIILKPSESIPVPVKFTATDIGKLTANIVAKHDAPESIVGPLEGYGRTEGLDASDWNFGTLFITKSGKGTVWFTNTGSTPATLAIDPQLESNNGIDHNSFYIDRFWTRQNNNVQFPITMQLNDTLFADVTFKPSEDRNYEAKIVYDSDIGTEISNLIGAGKIIRTVVEIPKGYTGRPGDEIEISVKLNKHPNETKPIEEADIKEFKARVYFKANNNPNPDIFPVFPLLSNPPQPSDIFTQGTLTQGWTVSAPEIIGKDELYLKFSNNTPLKLNGNSEVLFKFIMYGYLSDTDVIPLVPEFDPVLPYVLVDEIPGNIKIDPVCVNDLRLVVLSGLQYSLADVTPNPVTGKATVHYSIGIKSTAKLTLYNSYGEPVMTLVDKIHNPGTYELTVDPQELGLTSGVYYYRLESGPYRDSKSMVIVK